MSLFAAGPEASTERLDPLAETLRRRPGDLACMLVRDPKRVGAARTLDDGPLPRAYPATIAACSAPSSVRAWEGCPWPMQRQRVAI